MSTIEGAHRVQIIHESLQFSENRLKSDFSENRLEPEFSENRLIGFIVNHQSSLEFIHVHDQKYI